MKLPRRNFLHLAADAAAASIEVLRSAEIFSLCGVSPSSTAFIASNIATLTIARVRARDHGDSRCSVATASALAAQSDIASADAGMTSAESASALPSNATAAVIGFACISRLSGDYAWGGVPEFGSDGASVQMLQA